MNRDPGYESEAMLSQYLLFHYGEEEDQLPFGFGPASALSFPARCVSEGVDQSRVPDQSRALDLGCSVGRASFELSACCREVLGVDASACFIAAAAQLAREGFIDGSRIEEGDLCVPVRYRVPPELDRGSVRFERGDALKPRAAWGTFDILLAANLVDRVPDPEACLENMAGLVHPGGQLILTSPFTWMEACTPRARWLGGWIRGGASLRSWDRLQEILHPNFELVTAWDMPFLIREHARKYQWSVARAGRWIRKGK